MLVVLSEQKQPVATHVPRPRVSGLLTADHCRRQADALCPPLDLTGMATAREATKGQVKPTLDLEILPLNSMLNKQLSWNEVK